jgi:hypothetical protein
MAADRREEILKAVENQHPFQGINEEQYSIFFDAMDEYFKERALELLQFMADNHVDVDGPMEGRDDVFYYKGEWLTKEQLFETFL